MNYLRIVFLTGSLFLFSGVVGCTTIEEYEVGVGRTRITGNMHESVYRQGVAQVFTKSVYKYPTRELQYPEDNGAESTEVLTADNLPVKMESAFMWKVVPDTVQNLYKTVGSIYDVEALVYKSYREAVRDVIVEITAAELLSEGRQGIGTRIRELMNTRLNARGIEVTEFFVRDIEPPQQIKNAIEQKLSREQQVQTERYQTQVIEEQANQRRKEAEGIRDAQRIIAESLHGERGERYLYWRALEAMENVGKGSNNMVIVPTENGAPIFLGTPNR